MVIGPLYAAFGVACALARARMTGDGCYLDVSCADAVLSSRWLDAIAGAGPGTHDPAGRPPKR